MINYHGRRCHSCRIKFLGTSPPGEFDCPACGARQPAPPLPPLPTDRVALHVALWKVAKACGHDLALDAQQPDHVLVALVAELVTPALGKAFRDGYAAGQQGFVAVGSETINPYDGSEL